MMEAVSGGRIIRINQLLTVALIVATALAGTMFRSPWKTVHAVTSLICFGVGVFAFLWGYWDAVQRSRQDNISVAALYFLVDKCAPAPVMRMMNGLLGAQVVVGIAGASWRSSTDGKPGSTLAFGILAPMLGLGLSGLWGAHHGRFDPRITQDAQQVPLQGSPSGQDENHD